MISSVTTNKQTKTTTTKKKRKEKKDKEEEEEEEEANWFLSNMKYRDFPHLFLEKKQICQP